jgi:hypothetical protein
MAIQFRAIHRNPILEKGYELQKVCLGGKINTPQDIEKRMDTADLNMRNTCEYCKGGIKCLQSQCPVKYAHIKVISILLDMDDILQKFESKFFEEEENYKKILDNTLSEEELSKELSSWWYRQYKLLDIFPYVDAKEEGLQDLLALYKEAIEKANTSKQTGLDKIKNLFGGK